MAPSRAVYSVHGEGGDQLSALALLVNPNRAGRVPGSGVRWRLPWRRRAGGSRRAGRGCPSRRPSTRAPAMVTVSLRKTPRACRFRSGPSSSIECPPAGSLLSVGVETGPCLQRLLQYRGEDPRDRDPRHRRRSACAMEDAGADPLRWRVNGLPVRPAQRGFRETGPASSVRQSVQRLEQQLRAGGLVASPHPP